MIGRRALLAGVSVAVWLGRGRHPHAAEAGAFWVVHTDDEWRRLLTPAQFAILRREGTELPGSSPLEHESGPGRYDCVGCGQGLFSAKAKFDSHTGWPSFWQPQPGAVGTTTDTRLFMSRIEVHCSSCGGHLGHVFDDGPKPTGLRYCMNGAVLSFHPEAA